MDTYFIRHTKRMNIDEPTRNRLWNRKKIAIHFPKDKIGKLGRNDNNSLLLENYADGGLKALRILTELAENGGYVCAEYHNHNECVLGYIEPGSKITLLKGKWGHSKKKYIGRTAVLKSLTLKRVKLVSPGQFAPIYAARPRQGTIMRWYRPGELIQCIVEGKPIKISVGGLFTAHQEVMCSEFLRLKEAKKLGLSKLAHLILPVGRALKDIDIFGITETGKRLFGQVTFSHVSECEQKMNALLKYRGHGNELVLFCDSSEPARKDGIFIVPLKDVYEHFTKTPSGKQWLRVASKVLVS